MAIVTTSNVREMADMLVTIDSTKNIHPVLEADIEDKTMLGT